MWSSGPKKLFATPDLAPYKRAVDRLFPLPQRVDERIPLTDDKDAPKSTETTTRTTSDTEVSDEVLTPLEEKVVRARHGLDEDGDHELQFGLGADEETQKALARLEAFLVDAFEKRETTRGGEEHFFPANRVEAGDNDAKQKIIDALSDDE